MLGKWTRREWEKQPPVIDAGGGVWMPTPTVGVFRRPLPANAIRDFTRVCEQTGLINKLGKEPEPR